jgi:HlyD family secretion protein
MAIATIPKRAVRRTWQLKWVILGLIVVVGLTALAISLNRARSQPNVAAQGTPVVRPLTAQASLEPAQQATLTFASAGTVKAVNVKEGDAVKAGQVLATLDVADLQLKLQDAQANLAIQQAQAAQITEKAANADVTAAQTALDSALAKQKSLLAGATAADLKTAQEAVVSAQSALDNAQAQNAKVKAGATASDVAAATSSVKSAQAQLASAQQTLNDLKAKPKPADVATAELAITQAKNQLWSAQTTRDGTCGAAGSGSVQCQSANATVAAQETAVQSAQLGLVNAQQPATADQLTAANQAVQSAQAAVASAQTALAKVQAGPTAADLEAAQSQVDQAASALRTDQAKLAQLQAGPTAADQTAAQNDVDQARANLAKLVDGPTKAALALNDARIQEAQVQVAMAQQALQDAQLIAPFDGVVTAVSVVAGQPTTATTGSNGTSATITVADLSALHFETTDLDEVSAAKVSVGQAAKVTIPALNKQTFDGTVTFLAAQPSVTSSGNVNYTAKISLKSPPNGLRWGQTARVEFVGASP